MHAPSAMPPSAACGCSDQASGRSSRRLTVTITLRITTVAVVFRCIRCVSVPSLSWQIDVYHEEIEGRQRDDYAPSYVEQRVVECCIGNVRRQRQHRQHRSERLH